MPFMQNEALIRQTARDLLRAFAWAPKFREYYAVKVRLNLSAAVRCIHMRTDTC